MDGGLITSYLKITTCEMHTCGTPLRIVEDGFPKIEGKTMLQKVEFVKSKLDHLRKFILYEPRGHHFTAVLRVEPDHPDADVAVMFMEKEGYLSMCGEAVLSLGRYFVDKRLVPAREPETLFKIQCPCGPVSIHVEYRNGMSGRARFHSVPAFLFARDVEISLKGIGSVKVDVSYGGCFYAIASAQSLGLNLLDRNDFQAAGRRGREINKAVQQKVKLEEYPELKGLGNFQGTMLVDFSELKDNGLVRQMPVFGITECRGPCGSGTSASVAYLYASGLMNLNEKKDFQSAISGGTFSAQAVAATRCSSYPAVTVEVTGQGFYTGTSILTTETEDPLRDGFLAL